MNTLKEIRVIEQHKEYLKYVKDRYSPKLCEEIYIAEWKTLKKLSTVAWPHNPTRYVRHFAKNNLSKYDDNAHKLRECREISGELRRNDGENSDDPSKA